MSVIMTLQIQADPRKLEDLAAEDPDRIRGISERAKQYGVIAHRFYGSEDGRVMVADEWPDPESFQRFFEESQAEIEPLMRDAGVTSEPQITFWRELEIGDEIGWGA